MTDQIEDQINEGDEGDALLVKLRLFDVGQRIIPTYIGAKPMMVVEPIEDGEGVGLTLVGATLDDAGEMFALLGDLILHDEEFRQGFSEHLQETQEGKLE